MKYMIPSDTKFKILEYLVRLRNEKELNAKYTDDPYIRFLIDRQYIIDSTEHGNHFSKSSKHDKKREISGRGISKLKSTPAFDEIADNELIPLLKYFIDFINKHQINYIENTCSIDDIKSLITISKLDATIPDVEALEAQTNSKYTFQEILAKYFKSSKHTHSSSSLGKAINSVLGGEDKIDYKIENQAISILYPKDSSRCIVLCENKNRICASRHQYIEYWYAGGSNTHQLKFIPTPKLPIFYLFDWDYDGISIYQHIKEKYFPALQSVLPQNYKSLALPQTEVKHHRSKWKGTQILTKLTDTEKEIATYLIDTDSIIEEQRINVMAIEKLIR